MSGLNFDQPKFFPVRCPKCNWEGMSDQAAGGGQIADTGDYSDIVCPACIAPDGDHEKGFWIPVDEIPRPTNPMKTKLTAEELGRIKAAHHRFCDLMDHGINAEKAYEYHVEALLSHIEALEAEKAEAYTAGRKAGLIEAAGIADRRKTNLHNRQFESHAIGALEAYEAILSAADKIKEANKIT